MGYGATIANFSELKREDLVGAQMRQNQETKFVSFMAGVFLSFSGRSAKDNMRLLGTGICIVLWKVRLWWMRLRNKNLSCFMEIISAFPD